jgi:hypothetical protein
MGAMRYLISEQEQAATSIFGGFVDQVCQIGLAFAQGAADGGLKSGEVEMQVLLGSLRFLFHPLRSAF